MTVEYRRCAGVALITVLFILVLMTTFVVYMVDDEHIALRRISNQREAEGSYQLAVASEQWAVKVLERDLELDEKPGPKNDHLNEAWTKLEPLADFKDESGNVYASMKTFLNDESGKFNLNNLLASPPSTTEGTGTPTPPSGMGGSAGMDGSASPSAAGSWEIMFRNLLAGQGLKQELADALLDWLDEDDHQPRGAGGAEDDHYQLQDPSYRAANGFFNDIGELLLVKGFDKKIVTKLQPYVTVLPANDVKININTADPVVLSLLTWKSNEILEPQTVEALITGREEEGYKTIKDFNDIYISNVAGIPEGYLLDNYIDVQSRFFSVNSQAEFGRMSLRMKSLLHRRLDEKVVRVVSRRRGLS